MKLLITGATGLVGSALTRKLLESGHEVNFLSTSHKSPNRMKGSNGFFWDLKKQILDEKSLIGVNTIVHLAGANLSKRWTHSYKREIVESRVLSAQLIYNTLKENPHNVTHFISASGIAIYPDSLSADYSETETAEDESFLGHVVKKWEASADRFSQLGLTVAKIRTGPALSAKSGMLKELLKIINLGIGSPLGTGEQWQSWIHIDDLAGIYKKAIEDKWTGIFNATAPEPVTNARMMKAIATKQNKPFFMPNVPKFLLKLVLGEMHEMLLSSQRVRPKRTLFEGYRFKFPDLDSALENLLHKKSSVS